MVEAFNCVFDTSGINAQLDALHQEVLAAVRPAAQAGAQVFYQAMLQQAPRSAHGHWFHGTHSKYWFDAGTLRKSIYQVYSKDNSTDKTAIYHISWNHQKAPYGFMVEFGTSRAPAHPFMRPAFDTAHAQALNAAVEKFTSKVRVHLAG